MFISVHAAYPESAILKSPSNKKRFGIFFVLIICELSMLEKRA